MSLLWSEHSMICLQVQCSIQTQDTGVGTEANWYHRDYWDVDLPGGCVCWWWYCQTASSGEWWEAVLLSSAANL